MTDRAPTLDLAACVRLLEWLANHEEQVASTYQWAGEPNGGSDERENATTLRALASALPGMVKAREENEKLRAELATARENYDIMHASWKGLHWELDQLRKAQRDVEAKNLLEETKE